MLDELIDALMRVLGSKLEDVEIHIMCRHPVKGFVYVFRIRDRRCEDEEMWETGLGHTPERAAREVADRIRVQTLH